MNHEIQLLEIRRETSIVPRLNTKTTGYSSCVVLGKIGYLQGVFGFHADHHTDSGKKLVTGLFWED